MAVGCIECGLETLMFACGRSARPDVGQQIARAVRVRLRSQPQSPANTTSNTITPMNNYSDNEDIIGDMKPSNPSHNPNFNSIFRFRLWRAFRQGRQEYSLSTPMQSVPLLQALSQLRIRSLETALAVELGQPPDETMDKKGLNTIRIRLK